MVLERLAPHAIRLAIVIELCTLTATVWGWWMLRQHSLREDAVHFDALVQEADHALANRLQNYEAALWGGVGLIQSKGHWAYEGRRAEWSSYVQALDLDRRFPGMLGMGYIERVRPAQEAAYLARERADGLPDFAIHEVPGGTVTAADKLPISYVVPDSRNYKAFGLDIGSEHNRRQAAERAWTSGEATITGIIQLVQNEKRSAGFLVLVPARVPGNPAPDLWVYAPIIGQDVCSGVIQSRRPELTFAVYDQQIDNAHLIARLGQPTEAPTQRRMVEREHVYAGRSWRVVWRTTADFKTVGQGSSTALLITGLLFSALLMVVLLTVHRSHRQALHTAASTRATLLDTLESAGLGIWRLDRSDLQMTSKGPLLNQLSPELRNAQHLEQILEQVHPDDREAYRSWLQGLHSGPGTVREQPLRLRREEGGWMWCLCAGAAGGEQSHEVRGTLVDISRLIDIQEQLQRSEQSARRAQAKAENLARAKTEFLATMSHELRTPLNSILGFSERLRRTLQLNERQAAGLDAIQRNGRHLLELINNLLDMSRAEAGKMELERQPVSLGQLLRQVGADLEPLASDKQLHLLIETPDDDLRVSCDPLRTGQILTNLLGNAIKYSDAGPIRMSLHDECLPYGSRWAVVQVIDRGIGIHPEDLPRLFEKFQQLAPGQTRRNGGSGLGLALSLELAELQGGRIEVESRVGEGSTFGLRLPLETENQPLVPGTVC